MELRQEGEPGSGGTNIHIVQHTRISVQLFLISVSHISMACISICLISISVNVTFFFLYMDGTKLSKGRGR